MIPFPGQHVLGSFTVTGKNPGSQDGFHLSLFSKDKSHSVVPEALGEEATVAMTA